jgi:hypothetical protein
MAVEAIQADKRDLKLAIEAVGQEVRDVKTNITQLVQNPLDVAAQKLLIPAALSILRGIRSKKEHKSQAHSRLIQTFDWVSERPRCGGLFFCTDHVAVVRPVCPEAKIPPLLCRVRFQRIASCPLIGLARRL